MKSNWINLFVAAVGLSAGLAAGCLGGTSDLANAVKVDECQDTCDTQRFFDCYDAQLHAGCYDDCSAASQDDIDKFVGCVRNADFCDVACSTNIEGRAAEVPEDERVDTGREPEPPASNCQTACQAMAADMCIPQDCSPLCTDSEVAFAVVYCNSVRDGCDFPAECTGEMSPEDACLAGCDQLAFFDCIDAGDQTACRTACGTADDTARENFSACANNGICDGGECLDNLGLSAGADVSGCQDACDNLEFFDCIDAAGLSNCRTVCETATPSSVETFKSCAEGLCEDDSCYQQLLTANP